ncbi:hypothetical protein, conserved [Leishmania donovani]|uniref:Uncharacterized conserved protein (DUF2036), putative n=1 Tax=Leishmania donovani TaxID=5661 RepID=A0A3S7WWY5_LEIDO|nr:hypothetical protein, conserved [Leishmania donovani]AYU78707.1 Uncharacterized conserved protein (DUF2036), putative [Leishmania donovani]TPP45394.1 hypothetical protein CGC21_32895 [Leishmania donovani]CBZ34048.1 hypothetical protein, conserved [Leishmania donovani]
MDHIFVRSDFACRHEYRLVSVDDACVKQLKEQVYPSPSAGNGAARSKRTRASSPPSATICSGDVAVVFVMKGDGQLCLHDAQSTRSVRRVEYSNTMLLATRRLNRAGRSAVCESRGRGSDVCNTEETATVTATPLPASRVRQYTNNVVVASLSHMFDSHAAHPQDNVSAVLGESYLTIEELEGTDGGSSGSGVAGPSGRGYTFAQLARMLRSSPAELADLLQSIGAVVHRGLVRLLHPSLAHESLAAVLAFLDAAEPCDASWAAAREHLCPSVYPDVVLRSLEAVYGARRGAGEATKDNDSVVLVGMPALLNLPRVLVGLAGGVFDAHQAVVHRTLGTGEVACGLPLETFAKAWMDAIPSSLFGVAGIPHRGAAGAQKTLMEKLRGYVVVEPRSGGFGGSMQDTVWWVPKESLSIDFAARLRALFELRPQLWDQMELKEYVGTLVPPDQSFEHVIVRHTREYRIPGQPVQYAPLA